MRNELKKHIIKLNTREMDFFKKIDVLQKITTLGQQKKYRKMYHKDEYIGWTYSADDFKKLGVKNISVINPQWKPKQILPNKKIFVVNLQN